jgi:hypothetical protein
MMVSMTLGQQLLNRLTDQLIVGIPKTLLYITIDEPDFACFVNHQNPMRGDAHGLLEHLVRPHQRRHIHKREYRP